MLSQASFTHSLGFKLKKIPAFNTCVTRTMLDPSFSMTPKHSKKISSPLLNTMVTFTPKATHSRVNSLTMNPESPQAKQLPGSPPNKLIKCRISREGTRNLEDLLAPKPKAVDRLELKLISTLNRENKTPLSVTPKTPGKTILNFSNAISNIQIGSKKKVLVLPSKASEFVVSSAGQVLKRLPIKDQWRSLSPVGQSQTPQPQSVKMTTPGGQENQKIRFINKTPEEDGEENKTNYALFSQNSYAPQGSEGDEMPRTGSKFIKVKSQILKSWEEYKIKRDFLISKDGEDGMTDDNCIDGVDNGELSYERSKAKLTSVSQREPGTLDTEKHCCDRLIRREDRQHGENLSPDSGYNWQDRHNATMARKGQGQMVMKMKPKVGLGQEDLDCFVNVTLKYSGDPSFQSKKVKKLNYDLQLKKNREEGRKKLSAIRGYCKEVVTHGESHWKSGDRVVEKNNS